MNESKHDLDARLRAFFATAAAPPLPPGLEDRIVGRLGRRHYAFPPRSPRVSFTVDHPLPSPSGRAARFGAAAAALATAVALGAVGLASHHTVSGSGSAGAAVPTQQMTATASPVDLSGARAATAAFFDPSLPQCWKEPTVKGQAWAADSYARCPLTSRLANWLRDHEGLYQDWSFLTEARGVQYGLPPGVVPAWPPPSFLPLPPTTVTIGAPTATATGATVKVFGHGPARGVRSGQYENDAILIHTSAGWLIDDILIYGRNAPLPSQDPHAPGLYFLVDGSGFPVSLYNPCMTWMAATPPLRGC